MNLIVNFSGCDSEVQRSLEPSATFPKNNRKKRMVNTALSAIQETVNRERASMCPESRDGGGIEIRTLDPIYGRRGILSSRESVGPEKVDSDTALRSPPIKLDVGDDSLRD